HQYAHQHADGRRLAGPVGAEKAEDLASFHAEMEVAHGGELAIGLGQMLETDHVPFQSLAAGGPCPRKLASRPSFVIEGERPDVGSSLEERQKFKTIDRSFTLPPIGGTLLYRS